MINSKSKRIGIVLVGVLIVILVFVGIGENKMQSVKSVKKYIIKSNKIQSVQILDKTGNIIQEIDNEARIKRLTDILNRAVHDDDMNDGRMVKMKAAERTIKIIFRKENRYSRLEQKRQSKTMAKSRGKYLHTGIKFKFNGVKNSC